MSQQPEDATSAHRKLVVASAIGAAIEHFDFFCYAFIAPIAFSSAFFPKMDSLARNLAVYATFAVGFAARPLGGIVFGHIADRLGRRRVLILTLLLMGIASALIGCVPSYASIGLAAPILLVTLRFIQGFAFGGEYMNAVTLTLEGAPTGRRGLFASSINASGPAGVIAASGTIAAMTAAMGSVAFGEWGWRIPFICSAFFAAYGLYLRLQLPESGLFNKAKSQPNPVTAKRAAPIIEVLHNWKLPVLRAALINMVHSSFQYLCSVFVLGYAVNHLNMSAAGITSGNTIANILELALVPLIAIGSDRWGRRKPLLLGIGLAGVLFPLLMGQLESKDLMGVVIGIVVGVGLVHALMFAPEAAFSSEQFPTEVRVSGGSLGKQLGIVFGGGCAPLIATALVGGQSDLSPVTVYFELIVAAAFLVIWFTPESFKKSL